VEIGRRLTGSVIASGSMCLVFILEARTSISSFQHHTLDLGHLDVLCQFQIFHATVRALLSAFE
jgi:hypothetical protein